MDTAIYTSITQGALLGDAFWQVNARNVAAFGAAAMASNQDQNQNQYQNQSQYQNPNQYQGQSQYRPPNQYQSQAPYQHPAQLPNQNQHANQSSIPGTTQVMVPPTLAPSATKVKSEQDCFELLALEFSSLPDREMPPEVSDPAAAQQQQLATLSSAAAIPDHKITPNTPTNNLIARTIRAAMANIKPNS